MATIASLLVVMGMDTKGLTAGAAKAESSLAKTGVAASKFGSIANAAFLGIGVAAVAGIAIAIKAGSDLNEQINKSGEVFEEAAGKIIKFSETTATGLGIAQSEALEAAGNFGQLFDAAGFAEQAAAGMSEKMVTLAADLGSFNNIPVAEALEKIRAGLAGQARPLREVGIFLSEAAIEAEAYRTGIAETGAELTDAEKIQARYNLILEQSTKAQGDFQRTLGESLPNQLKVVKAELIDTAAALGMKLLPVALDFLKVVHVLVPVVGVLADNLGLLLGVALGWAALSFLPQLLFSIGLGLEAIGAASVASGIGNVAGSMAALAGTGPALGFVAVGVGAIYLAMKVFNGEAPTFAANLGHAAGEIAVAAGALDPLTKHLKEVHHEAIQSGKVLSDFGKEVRAGITEEIPGIIGTVTTMKETFSISPAELVKITRSWAEIAHTIAKDLRTIGNSDLKPAMREAISALPPEMRHAWVEGNSRQRSDIEKSIKDTYNVQKTIPELSKQALTGGTTIGKALMDGGIQGIASRSPALAHAVSEAVTRAIEAGKAAAQAKSPSRKMFQLGLDLMTGLQKGITDNQQKVIDAAQKVIDRAIREMEKLISSVQSRLDKVLAKASSFRDTIRGGFAEFMDLSGAFTQQVPDAANPGQFITAAPDAASIASFVQSQVAGAQQLADVLRALAAQGAGQELLSQVAQGGAAAIPFAQALLQQGPAGIATVNQALADISDLAGGTAEKLTNKFYAEKSDELRDELKGLREDLQVLKKPERLTIEFRPGADQAIRQLILQVIREMGLSRASN